MTILLLGGRGQVGTELRPRLARAGEVVAPERGEADLASPQSLRDCVRRYNPRIIVNAAAYNAVDSAETDTETARAVNAVAPSILAEEADRIGSMLMHFSSDYVFDGRKDGTYAETDEPAPLSVYGQSKLAGERSAARCRRHLILRTAWVFGVHRQNFVKTILQLGQSQDSLAVVADQTGTPTSAALIAEATVTAMEAMRDAAATDHRWGLYHLVAAGEATRHGFASYVIARANELGFATRAKAASIMPLTSQDYRTPASRPARVRLATEKIGQSFGIDLPHWTAGVDDVLQTLAANKAPPA